MLGNFCGTPQGELNMFVLKHEKNLMIKALGRALLQYTLLHGVCKDASQADSLYALAPEELR